MVTADISFNNRKGDMVLWTYPFKVNKALAAFGIDPTSITHEIRVSWQDTGKKAGFSAEETAFVMASCEFNGRRVDPVMRSVALHFLHVGKIDPSKKNFAHAMMVFDIDPTNAALWGR